MSQLEVLDDEPLSLSQILGGHQIAAVVKAHIDL
jgi:hypothetical protein